MVQTRKMLRFSQEKGKVLEVVEVEAPKSNKGKRRSVWLMVSLASELGLAIALPIAGGAFLGHILDNKLNTMPRMTLSFIFLGVFLAAANSYFIVRETREN